MNHPGGQAEYRAQVKAWITGTGLGLIVALAAAWAVTWVTADRVAEAQARYRRVEATVTAAPALYVEARPAGVLAPMGRYRAPVTYQATGTSHRAEVRVERETARGAQVDAFVDTQTGAVWAARPGASPLPDYTGLRTIIALVAFLVTAVAYALVGWRIHLPAEAPRHLRLA